MKSRMRPMVGVLGGVVAFSCTDQSAGNSVQTEDTVAARVISVDSILPWWSRPPLPVAVGILRVDSSNFDFSQAGSDGSDLDVRTLEGRAVPFDVVFWDKPGRAGRVQVRLDSDLLERGARFLFRWKLPSAHRADSAAVWADVPEAGRLAFNSVLVDDFEHGSLRNLLPGTQSWFASASDSATVSGPTLVSAGGDRTGTALRIAYSTRTSSKYCQIATSMGSGFHDIRALDSMVVWVRGSGQLSISFDRFVPGSDSKAWAHFALDTSWTRIRVRPRDLLPADGVGGNVGWDKVSPSVNNLTFLVVGNGTLAIDEVRLYGLNADDFR